MKKTLRSIFDIIVLPVTVLVIGSGSYHLYQNYKESKIKPGQIYVYTINDTDPFEEKIVRYQKVLAVKEGFVQYVDTATADTASMRVTLFLDDTKLISK
jgi:hypothetical protein